MSGPRRRPPMLSQATAVESSSLLIEATVSMSRWGAQLGRPRFSPYAGENDSVSPSDTPREPLFRLWEERLNIVSRPHIF